MVLSLYEKAWGPAAALVRRTDAQLAHARTVAVMRRADGLSTARSLARVTHRHTFPVAPAEVGGVALPQPIILAAGLVKGDGFGDEGSALAAVRRGRNILPGARSVPALLGAVEFGSFTRWPRLGNTGRTLWRDSTRQAMQNRVGLRNPGARAAAEYLVAVSRSLPRTFGINLAVSPGLDDLEASALEIERGSGLLRAGRQPLGSLGRPGTRSTCPAPTPTTIRAPTRPAHWRAASAPPWSSTSRRRSG